MTDESSTVPSAELVEVDFNSDGGRTPIQVDGEALVIDGYYQPRIFLRIGSGSSCIRITLTPKDARGLRDDLNKTVEDARTAVQERLEKEGDS